MTPGGVIDTINSPAVRRAVITHLYPARDRGDDVGRIREGTGAEDIPTMDV